MSTNLHLKSSIDTLPDTPGVYFFRDKKNKILYIGKATSLRDRVKSYLSKRLFAARGPLLVRMVSEAKRVTFVETDSVLEALILEAHLIKKHQPEYNTRDKDNKSWNYVIITNEDFPRLLVERAQSLPERFGDEDIKYQFGPFTSSQSLRSALKIIRKLFPYRDKCTPFVELSDAEKKKSRPCFNQQIGLCPGVCTGEVSKKEYARTIQHIKFFFEGRKSALIKSLEREMQSHAKKEEFEKAEEVKRKLFALRHINDAALLTREDEVGEKYSGGQPGVRLEAYDISHLSGEDVIGVMVVVEDGRAKKSDYRRFKIARAGSGDTGALKEVLERRLRHPEWPLPDIVVMDGGVAQKQVARRIFDKFIESGDGKVRDIQIVSVVKDEKHQPRQILGDKRIAREYEAEILLANAESHRFAIAFQKLRRSKRFINRSSK